MNHIASPDNTDPGIERLIQAKGADVAPRVTPADVQANIVSAHYFTADDGVLGALADPIICKGGAVTLADVPKSREPLNLLTFCVLTLKNGFTVTGESACASQENFNAEVGQRIARANAEQKIWSLMGYALKDRLASGEQT